MQQIDFTSVAIIGGGLAGCECAMTLAQGGVPVTLFEQKPHTMSEAHREPYLSELVCSNSLRSNELTSGIGLLKQEMRELGSHFMQHADACAVPAGKALAVDRHLFATHISHAVQEHPHVTLRRQCIDSLDDAALEGFSHIVVAAGPLASHGLAHSLGRIMGADSLYFYDAIAPIVTADSLNRDIVFRASRYQEPEEGLLSGEYLNCPMNKEEYEAFYAALMAAEKTATRDFEKEIHFEGCMPLESLAERGPRTLTFGSLKPVGFVDPRTGRRPWALLQLRAENCNESMYNLVGCQTKLTYKAQEHVFRLVPGLEQVEFIRYGSMHRNTYVNAPAVLDTQLRLRAWNKASHIRLAGQITGVEGYVESAACGLWVALLILAELQGRTLIPPPQQSALGAMLAHLTRAVKKFQPSNAHFGLMPDLDEKAKKKERKALYAQRAREAFTTWHRHMHNER